MIHTADIGVVYDEELPHFMYSTPFKPEQEEVSQGEQTDQDDQVSADEPAEPASSSEEDKPGFL